MYAFLFSKAANLLASDLCLCSSVICIFAFSLWILFRVFQGGECCKEGTDTWVSRGEIQVRSVSIRHYALQLQANAVRFILLV